MAQKRIILTADDYGACNFIDDAIIKAIKERKINSVAAFVSYPDSEIRLKRLIALQDEEREKGNHFGIGLHYSITAGWAVTRRFTTLSYPNGTDAIFRDAYDYPFQFVSKLEMQEELDAQITLLGKWLGSIERIDHVSNHHGITYVDSDMFQCYSQVIQAFKIPMRSPLNWSVSGLKYKDFDPFIPSIPLARQGIKLRWMDKLADVTPAHIHQRVNYARGLNIKFPYCVNDTFYGQPFYENLDFLLLQYADPIFSKDGSDCAEMMFHLGNYENSPYSSVPSQQVQTDGIDQGYFNNRKLELRTLRIFDLERALSDLAVTKITYREL